MNWHSLPRGKWENRSRRLKLKSPNAQIFVNTMPKKGPHFSLNSPDALKLAKGLFDMIRSVSFFL